MKITRIDNARITRRNFLRQVGSTSLACLWGRHLHFPPNQEPPPTYIPLLQKSFTGDRFNVISIVADTLRYDHVGFLGNTWIQTPNIDAFAAQSQVFDRMYAGGFPTVINRAEFFTGRYMFHRIGWSDLPDGEEVLVDVFNSGNYLTGLVFDTWHIKDHGFSYDRGFQSWEWIRGQEGDRYSALPIDPVLPCSPTKLRDVNEVKQHLRNIADLVNEEDYPTPKAIRAAVNWLERHADQGNFFLHLDSFNPHEPWTPPVHYIERYSPVYTGEQVISPAYAPPDYMTAAELAHARALYAAEVTFVDHWLGVLFDALESMNLAASTVVAFWSDHGFLLGEHNAVGKSWDHNGIYQAYPFYTELNHVPLMLRVPGIAPQRLNALAQPIDILPTLLDYAGIALPSTIDGTSLRPAIANPHHSIRPVAVSSRSLNLAPEFKPMITVTDGAWALLYGGRHAPSELYHLAQDPAQQTNLIGTACTEAVRLHAELMTMLATLNLSDATLAQWSVAPCG